MGRDGTGFEGLKSKVPQLRRMVFAVLRAKGIHVSCRLSYVQKEFATATSKLWAWTRMACCGVGLRTQKPSMNVYVIGLASSTQNVIRNKQSLIPHLASPNTIKISTPRYYDEPRDQTEDQATTWFLPCFKSTEKILCG